MIRSAADRLGCWKLHQDRRLRVAIVFTGNQSTTSLGGRGTCAVTPPHVHSALASGCDSNEFAQGSAASGSQRIPPGRLEAHLREGLHIGLVMPGVQHLRRLLADAHSWHQRALALLRPGACPPPVLLTSGCTAQRVLCMCLALGLAGTLTTAAWMWLSPGLVPTPLMEPCCGTCFAADTWRSPVQPSFPSEMWGTRRRICPDTCCMVDRLPNLPRACSIPAMAYAPA